MRVINPFYVRTGSYPIPDHLLEEITMECFFAVSIGLPPTYEGIVTRKFIEQYLEPYIENTT